MRYFKEVCFLDSGEEVLEIRDCQIIARQIQHTELSQMNQLIAELNEEGSGFIFIDQTVREIQRNEILLRPYDGEDMVEFINLKSIIS